MAEMIFPVPTLIKNVMSPVDLTDAATKTYVDTKTASVFRPAAGSNNHIQYKSGTAFAASANLVFDPTTKTLTVDKIVANGSLLTSIANTSIVGKVASSLVADTVTTNAQPNITSVGTLTSLSISGNLSIGGDVTVTGNLNYANVRDLVVGDPLVYIGANNVSNVLDLGIVASYTSTSKNHTGLVRDHADGKWKLFDNVATEPTTVVDFANSTLAPFQAGNATFGNVVTANYFSGSGNLLANVQGANVTGNVAHASHAYVADSANTIAGANVTGSVANATLATTATVAGTVTTNAQPNITSVGTLGNLVVSGNVSAGNIKTNNILYANGSPFIFNMSAVGSNTQVQFNDAGNFSGSTNLTFNKTTGTLAATAFTGDGSNITGVDANTLNGHPTSYFATSSQGTKADSAVQPGDLSTVATSGSYTDLSNKPILGTAAATNSTAYATAAQGAKADTAVQPSALTGLATETYVNNAVANVQVDLTGYATTTYVDDAVANVQVDLTGYATETFVTDEIANLVASAPSALNTLNELAAALNNDPSFATSLATTIGDKLSTSDFTSTADTWLGTKSTNNVTEGTNQYYTAERANTAIDTRVTKSFVDNLNVDALTLNGSNSASFATAAQGTTADSAVQPGDNVSELNNDAGYLVSSDITSKLNTSDFSSTADTWLTSKSTTNLTEGTNQYYTVTRANTAIDNRVTQSFVNDLTITNVGTLSSLNVNGNITANYFIGDVIGNIIGQFHVPGADTEVLFNADGNASASSAFKFDSVSNTLSVTGAITASTITANILAGDGGNVTGVLGNTIIGSVSQADSANTVSDSYQPNITTVGSLGNLTVLGVIDAGVGVETSNVFDVSGTTAIKTYLNGTSGDVGIGGNLTVGINSNLANVTASHFIGNGSQLTGMYSNTEANAAIDNRVTKTFVDNLNIDADTLDGLTSSEFATSAQGNLADSSVQPGDNITTLSNDAGYLVANSLYGYATESYVGNAISAIPPTDFTGYATELYVSNAISNIPPTDFTGYATESYVDTAVANLVDSAPNALNTLNELAAALGDDSNFASSVTTSIGTKLATADFNSTANAWISNYSGNLSAGNLTTSGTSGNISGADYVIANYFIGDGSQLTGLPANYGNADVANYLPTHTSNVSGNIITANYFAGNGSNLSSIQGSNVTGNVGNAVYAYSVSGANVSGAVATATTASTITSAAQPNITSVGTLTTLQISGMLTANNANFAGNVNFAGAIVGDGSSLSNVTAVTANSASTATTAGTVTTAAQPNITSVGTLTSLSISGNVTSNSYFIGNGSQLTGIYSNTNANAAIDARVTKTFVDNLGVVANVAGTVTTAAQPNITSLGTLTGLTANGNVTASYFFGDGSQLTGLPGGVTNYFKGLQILEDVYDAVGAQNIIFSSTNDSITISRNFNNIDFVVANSQPNITSIGTLSTLTVTNTITGNISGTAGTAIKAGTVTTNAQPNITSVGTLTSLAVTGNITSGNASLGNVVVANYFSGAGNLLSNISGSNITGQVANALIAGTVYTNAQPNITSVGTLTSLTVTGNITGNITGSASSATTAGTVTAAAQSNITSVGTLTSLTVSGTFTSTGNVVLKKFNETVLSSVTTSGTISPDVSTGTIFRYTLNGNITLNSLANAVAGTSVTIILTQDATGSRTLSSTMKFSSGSKTLSTAANAIDVISVFYDGATYYASLSKGFA